MVEVENLAKKFKSGFALQDVNLKIASGESVSIIGSSGSGKTTLLRLINHLIKPDAGKVSIDGLEINEKNKLLVRRKIGMVFQNFNLFPHLSILNNLLLAPMQFEPQKEGEYSKKAIDLLKRFNLEGSKDLYPSVLSGGQKQRVAISRSMMMNPKIILFDEPTSALDAENIKDVVEIISELRGKISLLIVTHHLKFASKVSDRIIFMDGGRILCDHPTEKFLNKPSSQRARLFINNVKSLE